MALESRGTLAALLWGAGQLATCSWAAAACGCAWHGVYGRGVSLEVTIDQLFADLALWGAGFLTTVGSDERVRFVALRPGSMEANGEWVLTFDRAGRTATANVGERPEVSIAFPPNPESEGFSLIVDGAASVSPDVEGRVLVRPTWAVKHRPAP